jgi:hypothetical protein
MAEPTLTLLRADIWPTLKQRLDEAALQSSSAAASDVVARPVELLALMAADALPALGEDALAAERLRMLLYLAAPFQALVDEARTLEGAAARDGEAGYEPGVLDHGGLALLGLAAIRVAPAAGHEAFVRTVHGLALSAAPAEVLGRLVPRLPEGDGLAVILDTLYLLDTVGAALKTPLLRPFASDPAERARWRCLGKLFDDDLPSALAGARSKLKLGESKPLPWDGASSALVDDVQPQEAAAGQPVKVNVRAGKPGDGVRVVFASAGQPPLGARLLELEPAGKGAQLTVEVPHGAQGGWVGLSDDKLIEASNELRAALRETLPAALQRRGCLKSTDVPASLVPSIGVPDPARPGKLLATPPRSAGARWAGPPGAVHARSISRETNARTVPSGAPRVLALHVAQAGRQAPLFAGQPLEVEVLLDGPAAPGEVQLQLDPPHPGVQLAPGTTGAAQRLRFAVPAAAAEDGLLITARMASPSAGSMTPKTACSSPRGWPRRARARPRPGR